MADRPLFIRLSLPGGLEDTLEGLAREVLRNKPKNIYEFAADYFEELLRKRNEGESAFFNCRFVGNNDYLLFVVLIYSVKNTDRLSIFCYGKSHKNGSKQ